ncbi:MAG: flagellar protein FliT [Pseudomonadota bacterium]
MSETTAHIAALTGQMLEAAAAEDWQETERLAVRRAALLEARFASLPEQEAKELAVQIASADQALRTTALNRRAEVEQMLSEFGERRAAARAYLDTASAEV